MNSYIKTFTLRIQLFFISVKQARVILLFMVACCALPILIVDISNKFWIID